MTVYTVQAAKTHLSRILHEVEAGADVVIARGDQPVARLVALDAEDTYRPSGTMSFIVPDDFDAPLSDEELAAWE